MTHFDLFGLPASVDLDVKALEQRHRELALAHHPDRAPASDARARRLAAEQTAALNDAVTVLRDPVRRALYLLKLRGVDLESEQAAAKVQLPLEFLEEILERREALEALRARRDVTGALAMADDIRARAAAALTAAQEALRRDDTAAATASLGRVRYYTRFLEEVDALEEESLS